MTCGIYMIQNLINGKIYIGQAVDIKVRWKNHRNELRGNYHVNKHLQGAWNKYGEDNFEFSIVCECDENQLNTIEEYYIFELMSYDKRVGYNKTYGGGGCKATEEIRKKISEANKIAMNRPEVRKRMSENNARYWTGKTFPEETRQKISEATKGKIVSEETRKKLSKINKGKTLSEEHRKKISESNKGKTRSVETRRKMSESTKIAMNRPEVRKKLSENNARYWTGKTMSEESNKKRSEALKGENNHWYGKHLPEETRKKMSESHKGKQAGENHPMYGKHHTEETRKKLSEANKGKTLSEETKKKIREASKGRKHSEETRKKISEAKKGFKSPNSIPVVQLTLDDKLVNVYASAGETRRDGFTPSTITACVKGRIKTHKGYKWMYLSDYEAMKKEG